MNQCNSQLRLSGHFAGSALRRRSLLLGRSNTGHCLLPGSHRLV